MKCLVCSSLFPDYMENCLSQDVIDELEHHFRFCEKCRVCFSTYRLTVMLSSKVEQPAAVSPESVERLTSLLIQRFFNGARGA
ncbi:MAG TPA: hypothetical protein PLS81_11180 [Deltaproteobacteria bacterium]|nr:hypothetical protein [Deltaproteobacteria bacterium]HOM30004.1 hypothetical protein [Deltaproteobacteria bacterium]HPP79508.1 hypothetical protein [Deltaproteobacteria bacterium]